MKSEKIRKGRAIVTILCDEYHEATFHEIDNLDTKSISESENNYEESFIRIRESLQHMPWCCDNREDVLSICQVVVDELRENLLIRKDEP